LLSVVISGLSLSVRTAMRSRSGSVSELRQVQNTSEPKRSGSARWPALALLLTLGPLSSCSQAPVVEAQTASSAASTVPALYETQAAIDAYVSSGRYAADVAAVVAQARAWLEQRAPLAKRPAIVVDIDETALSNWPAYRVNGWARIVNGDCDLQAGPCNVRKWQELGRSPALPSTQALVRRARELGVAVFFLTGRPATLREVTERNLREQGYSFERVILRPEGTYASATDFKAPARCGIEREGYTVLLTLGDQQSDLDGGCAARGFKLPNPVYYLP
jgi:predicted secreted acid phosphatase